jgi:hypothetical protein
LDTYTSYNLITKDMDKSIDRVEAEPITARETQYYLDNITKVKSVEDFMKNDRLFKFAMKAHGLKDMDYAKAFMKKALAEGIDEIDSFANKLTDKRYAEFVETFNFARHGEAATVFTRAQQGTVDKYLRQTLEENAGKDNEGVRLALYFQRKAPDLNNFYEVLADPALGKVVRTALSLPDSFATADVDKQVKYFEEKIDLDDLKDAKGLDKFLKRFTSLWELKNPTATAQTSVSVLFSQPAEYGVSTDLLFAMQKLKL